MYADKMTPSMERAIGETDRRRKIQSEYNEKHHITPKGIVKSTENAMSALSIEDVNTEDVVKKITSNKEEFEHDVDKEIELLTTQMKLYAKNLEFELAAKLRDEIDKLKKLKTKQ